MLRTPWRRVAPSAALALALALALAGCSEDPDPAPTTTTSEPSSAQTPTASQPESPEAASDAAARIEITLAGDTVEPSGERVQVPAGEEIELLVTADAPGEIHVHATPEQVLSYEAGTTTLPLRIDQPGVVEVEAHELEVVIVQLEVR